MDRRDFLTANKSKKVEPVTFGSPTRTLSGINPYTGPWTTNEVIHLLKRTMFGAKKSDVDFFTAMTMSQAVDYLLNVSPAQSQPLPPVKDYANSTDPLDPDNAVAARAVIGCEISAGIYFSARIFQLQTEDAVAGGSSEFSKVTAARSAKDEVVVPPDEVEEEELLAVLRRLSPSGAAQPRAEPSSCQAK